MIELILKADADILLMGHSGSTSAQPIINAISKGVREQGYIGKIIIGGVFPTYHWKEILESNPQIDFIVCGEGEEIVLNLVNAIKGARDVSNIKGIAFRSNNEIIKTF